MSTDGHTMVAFITFDFGQVHSCVQLLDSDELWSSVRAPTIFSTISVASVLRIPKITNNRLDFLLRVRAESLHQQQ